MKFCKRCLMPDTRPGITFDEEGVCIACRNHERKKAVDWNKRWDELKSLCDKYRRKTPGEYDCVIAVSGGKDSYYQVHIMKEKMNMNPLLVTASDPYTMTEAGKHNIQNITEAFGCNLIEFKPDRRAARIITRYMFEKYGRPNWYIDRWIYTAPLYIAGNFNIPLVVYGENVSYEYGGVDDEESYSAKQQINNGVAPGVDLKELESAGVPREEMGFLEAPSQELLDRIDPIYLSYFVEWNSVKNYEFAKTRGFQSLEHEWDRVNHIENFCQVDSIGYLFNSYLKFVKYGHARSTDYASRWIRYGLLTREEGLRLVEEKDHTLDSRTVEDFCRFTELTHEEFYGILEKLYNTDLLEKNSMGQWRLKQEFYEKRRNP